MQIIIARLALRCTKESGSENLGFAPSANPDRMCPYPRNATMQIIMARLALRRIKESRVEGSKPVVELPPKHINEVKVTLSAEHRAKYDRWEQAGGYRTRPHLLHHHGHDIGLCCKSVSTNRIALPSCGGCARLCSKCMRDGMRFWCMHVRLVHAVW